MTKRTLNRRIYTCANEGCKRMLLILLFFSPAFLDFSCRTAYRQDNNPLMPVIRVVDGDTFWADDGTINGLKVRLIGLDAPEIHATARKEAGYFVIKKTYSRMMHSRFIGCILVFNIKN